MKRIIHHWNRMNQIKMILEDGSRIDYIFLFLFNMMLKFAYVLFRNDPEKLERERAELIKLFYGALKQWEKKR